MTIRVFSFGGGVQSTAALVLAAQGRIDYRTFLFCNVGEDSESPDTLAYVRDVSVPFAREHGLELTELRKLRRGVPDTVLGRVERNHANPSFPLRGAGGMPAFKRACTVDFKVVVIGRWLKARGATAAQPATVGIGISADEYQRVNRHVREPYEVKDYPLVDLRLTRQDCLDVVRRAGLPQAPRSSCYFCPFHSLPEWRNLRSAHPDLFAKAARVEADVNTALAAKGKKPVYLTRFAKPLPMAITGEGQTDFLDDLAGCDSGHCMT